MFTIRNITKYYFFVLKSLENFLHSQFITRSTFCGAQPPHRRLIREARLLLVVYMCVGDSWYLSAVSISGLLEFSSFNIPLCFVYSPCVWRFVTDFHVCEECDIEQFIKSNSIFGEKFFVLTIIIKFLSAYIVETIFFIPICQRRQIAGK